MVAFASMPKHWLGLQAPIKRFSRKPQQVLRWTGRRGSRKIRQHYCGAGQGLVGEELSLEDE